MVRQKEILENLMLGLFCELLMEVWYTFDVSVSSHHWYTTIISSTIFTLKICWLREGVGVATNNAAEYRAMVLGMKYALKKGFICIQGDSKLVSHFTLIIFPLSHKFQYAVIGEVETFSGRVG